MDPEAPPTFVENTQKALFISTVALVDTRVSDGSDGSENARMTMLPEEGIAHLRKMGPCANLANLGEDRVLIGDGS